VLISFNRTDTLSSSQSELKNTARRSGVLLAKGPSLILSSLPKQLAQIKNKTMVGLNHFDHKPL
jgi:hypothetical protein